MRTLRTILLLAVATTFNCAAFNYTISTNSVIEHWAITTPDPAVPTNSFNTNTHAIRYYISSDGWSTTNTAAELNAVRNSFGQWQSIPGTVIKFEEAGLIAPYYRTNALDNTNVVYWSHTSTINQNDISGALGFTSTRFTVPSNVITQFDIVLNGTQYNWFTDFNDKNNAGQFVESNLLHEIGHSLGLQHASMGGATMLFEGTSGIDAQAGLSADEIAFAKSLYPNSNTLATLGNVSGTVTKSGSPVFGAAVVIEGTNGIVAGSSVTQTNGSVTLKALPPGDYNMRVVPLDPSSASDWLIRGADIASSFNSSDTSFFPTGNSPITLTAGATNTANFTVTNGTPAFRITLIRDTTANANSYSIGQLPTSLIAGQSNYAIGVFSADLPTNNATLTITGDGLTVGAPSFSPPTLFPGLNGISVSISVASNATPGLRSFIVRQNGNVAYANGFFEVLPTVIDYNFDGLNDVFQRTFFAPFTSANAGPAADPDGDGFNNYSEYVAGTSPIDSQSLLKLQSVTTAVNGTTVRWIGVVGKRYQLMGRADAVLGSWKNVSSIYTAATTNAQVLDPSATNGIHFYRVQALP